MDSLRGEVSTLRSREEDKGEEADRQAEKESEAVAVSLRARLAEAAERERDLIEELEQVRCVSARRQEKGRGIWGEEQSGGDWQSKA